MNVFFARELGLGLTVFFSGLTVFRDYWRFSGTMDCYTGLTELGARVMSKALSYSNGIYGT